MIALMKDEYPVETLCEVLECSRSTAYYQPQPRPDEAALWEAIEQVLMRWPFYGYRRVMHQLRREGWAVGEHRVRRILSEMDHDASVGPVRLPTTDSRHPHPIYPNRTKGIRPQRPDYIWVGDITYIRYGRDFLYLAVILDACTRRVRGWALSDTLHADTLTVKALNMALDQHGPPSIFHSDQGSQYACWDHVGPLLEGGTRISMSDTGCPTQNGIAERFMRTLKEEHVDYSEYRDYEEAVQQLTCWLEVEYNTERIHSALDYRTPAEYEVVARAAHPPLLVR